MINKINRSLRRHNKRNHGSINGVLHLGNSIDKTGGRSKKAKLIDDKSEPLKVSINEIFTS